MTREQAAAELGRLCEALDRKPEELRPGQMAVWLDMLEELPYEVGRAAIRHIIRTYRGNRFPAPGTLTGAVEQVRQDGIPSAGAYSQDAPRTSMTPAQVKAAIDQMDRWVAMSDEEYMAELERIKATLESRQGGGRRVA